MFVFCLFCFACVFLNFFQQPCFSIFSIWTSMFCFTHRLCLVATRRKFYNIIQCKDILDPPSHYINACTVKWFLKHNNEPVCVQTLMPILPDRYSLRHDITHNFLSAYYLYSNLSKGFPFLECLNTVAGLKVTDRSFKTILDTVNNLTELIL